MYNDNMKQELHLIFGGAWSGKTARAETLARSYSQVIWIGTGARTIPDMDEHIRSLQAGRPNHWQHIESPLDLIPKLKEIRKKADHCLIVIDSFSQWISNEIAHRSNRHDDRQLMEIGKHESDEFFSEIESASKSNSILVISADFGQSLPPQDAAQRTIRMCVGTTNARLGSMARTTELIQSGFVIYKNQR